MNKPPVIYNEASRLQKLIVTVYWRCEPSDFREL